MKNLLLRKIINLFKKDIVYSFKNSDLFILNKKYKKFMYTNSVNNITHHGEIYEPYTVGSYLLHKIPHIMHWNKIPYFDGEYPTKLTFYSTKELESIIYLNMNGLGGCTRSNAASPVVMEFYKNGNIKYEHYQEYATDNMPRVHRQDPGAGSPFVYPLEIFYNEDGSINPIGTRWRVGVENNYKEFTYEEYKSFLLAKDINIDNFKNLTVEDKHYIEIFFNYKKYQKLLTELNIKEDDLNSLTLEQINLIKMCL